MKKLFYIFSLVCVFTLVSSLAFAQQRGNDDSGSGNGSQGQTQTDEAQEESDVEVETQEEEIMLISPYQGGNGEQEQNANQIQNQGEDTQIQNQEQEQGAEDEEDSDDESGQGSQWRNMVASAVQTMLEMSERYGQGSSIGLQIHEIAQEQNQNRLQLEEHLSDVQGRGSIMHFFFGAKYGAIEDVQEVLKETRVRLGEMEQIKDQLQTQTDIQNWEELIEGLEQVEQEAQGIIEEADSGFSLLGWLVKLFH